MSIMMILLQRCLLLYEQQPVNTTQDLIVHSIDDVIPTKLEPWSNKENPEEIVDDDDEMTDDDDHIDHTLIRNGKTGSLETRNEKMQTPIHTPPRSFMNDLSLDKAKFVELTDNHDTISKVLRTSNLPGILKKIDDALHVGVPKISIDATNAYDDPWTANYDINDGVFISEEADTKVMAEIQGTKWVPTIADYDKMKFAHNNILKSQCRIGAEYEYHLQQIESCARDPNAPARYLFNKDLFFFRNGNTEAKKYIISLHKFHETLFLEDDLEELLKRW
ncbi:hypothetical protein Tco_1425444, partial [Tanacetum coccineum]